MLLFFNKLIQNRQHTLVNVVSRATGKLNTQYLKTLFDQYKQKETDPARLSTVICELTYLANERLHYLTDPISTAWLEASLQYLAQMNLSMAIESFNSISIKFYSRDARNKPEPFSESALQVLVDLVIAADLKLTLLQNFVYQIGHIISNRYLTGEIDRMEKILEKIPATNKNLSKVVLALINMSFKVKTPLHVELIEKFMIDESKDMRARSMVFSAIHMLARYEKLSGVFTIDIYQFLEPMITKQIIDETKHPLNILCCIAYCLLHHHVDAESQPKLIEKLNGLIREIIKQLYNKQKSDRNALNANDATSLFNALKIISQCEEFTDSLNMVHLNLFLNRQLSSYECIRVMDSLHSLGIASRRKLVRNVPVETIKKFFDKSLDISNIKITYFFKGFVGVADLIANDALDEKLDYHYLAEKSHEIAKSIASDNEREKEEFWKGFIPDIKHLLQVPEPLNGSVLFHLMPLMTYMLGNKPDNAARSVITNALIKFIKSEPLPGSIPQNAMQNFNKLTEMLASSKEVNPALFKLLIIESELRDMRLLDGKINVTFWMDILMKMLLPDNTIQHNHGRIGLLNLFITFIKKTRPDARMIANVFNSIGILTEYYPEKKQSPMQYFTLQEQLYNLPWLDLEPDQLLAIVDGLRLQLRPELLEDIRVVFFAILTKLGTLDKDLLSDICCEKWCEKLISTYMLRAASCGDVDDIKMLLPFARQCNNAVEMIKNTCERAANGAAFPDVVRLLLESSVLSKEMVQSILDKTRPHFILSPTPERLILLLFTIITYDDFDASFYATILKYIQPIAEEPCFQSSESETGLVSRLNNLIQYACPNADTLKQHGLFASRVNSQDAQKILDCLDFRL